MRGTVETWVNSQWKYLAAPGQLSVEINNRETGKLRSDTLHITDSDFDTIDSNCSPADSEANAVFAIVELHAACAVVDRIFLWLSILDAKFRHL